MFCGCYVTVLMFCGCYVTVTLLCWCLLCTGKCHCETFRCCSCCAPIISCSLCLSGLTGVLLFVVMIIIFVFAHPIIRKKAYKFFWSTHSLYIVLYILCLVHGLARLTGAPRFWLFFIGPGIIYTLDKVSLSQFCNRNGRQWAVCQLSFSSSDKISLLWRLTVNKSFNFSHTLTEWLAE
jgi:hypothetical protein